MPEKVPYRQPILLTQIVTIVSGMFNVSRGRTAFYSDSRDLAVRHVGLETRLSPPAGPSIHKPPLGIRHRLPRPWSWQNRPIHPGLQSNEAAPECCAANDLEMSLAMLTWLVQCLRLPQAPFNRLTWMPGCPSSCPAGDSKPFPRGEIRAGFRTLARGRAKGEIIGVLWA